MCLGLNQDFSDGEAEKKGTQLRVLSRTELFPVLIITVL